MHYPLWFVTSCSNSPQMVKQILKYWFGTPLLKVRFSRGIDEKPSFNNRSLNKGMLCGRWNFSLEVWGWHLKLTLAQRWKMMCKWTGNEELPSEFYKKKKKIKLKKEAFFFFFRLKEDEQIQNDWLLWFKLAGGSAPHGCLLTTPFPVGWGENRKKEPTKWNVWVEIKLFTKIEKRERIIIMACICMS